MITDTANNVANVLRRILAIAAGAVRHRRISSLHSFVVERMMMLATWESALQRSNSLFVSFQSMQSIDQPASENGRAGLARLEHDAAR
jgi:hypothetical protein